MTSGTFYSRYRIAYSSMYPETCVRRQEAYSYLRSNCFISVRLVKGAGMNPAHWQLLKQASLWLALASVACVVSAAIAVWFIVRIPATYLKDDTSTQPSSQNPILKWTGIVLKNALGVVLIVAGVVMLI